MALEAGARLGPYEIESTLGAGGMGEVYRARDTRLDRTVAIKVLNSQVAVTPELKARFEREARVISQLHHPHICVLHDIGCENQTDFLVMEFLEGESLGDRLRRGPLPLDQLLKFATELADALEKAHRAGIIHRDLKPGNVMMTKSGAKLLDFGLAKPVAVSSAAANSATSSVFATARTMTSPASPLSSVGAVIGTMQYMAPEQIAGQDADARSDVFAFGALLYEMATGKRAFDGKTQASVVGAILANDPAPIATLQPRSPATLNRLVQSCLVKDPDERVQTMHDVKLRLIEIAEAPQPSIDATHPSRRRQLLPWAIAVLVALLSAAAVYVSRPADPRPVQLSLTVPSNLSFNDKVPDSAVISPDGSKLAFSATTADGKWQLYVRRLDTADVQIVPGSDDPIEPFWSPDSRSIAFGSFGKLKRVDLDGGGAQVLCDAARITGGSWSPKGVIIFSSDYGSLLYQIPATGGQPKPVTSKLAADDFGHSAPWFLPDGDHFLFSASGNSAPKGLWLGSLSSSEQRQLVTDNTRGVYASGYLLFVRNGALMAQPFDTGSLRLKGDAKVVVAPESTNAVDGFRQYSASNNGVLVWPGTWEHGYQLRWFDRAGHEIGSVGEPIVVNSGEEPHISPDGKQVVLKARERNAVGRIWVMDLERGTGIRLTTGQLPLWAPDGRYVFYQAAVSKDVTRRGIVRMPANGAGEPELLAEGVKFPHAVTPDGRFIIYLMRGEKTRLDIWALPTFGDKKEHPVLDSVFDERDPQLSSDGKWLAYTSDESGAYEIYVRSFTSDGKAGDDKRRVSTTGGVQPIWNANGKELLYLTDDGQVMSVPVSTAGGQIAFGVPKALFKTRTLSHFNISHEYDMTRDGQRLLIGTLVGEPKAAPTVMLNWIAALKK